MSQQSISLAPTVGGAKIENPVLDKLAQFMDKSALLELVNSFIDRADLHIQKASKSIVNLDHESLHFALHTMKGSSANVGLLELSQRCEAAEKNVAASDNLNFGEIGAELAVIIELLESGKTHLQAYLDSR